MMGYKMRVIIVCGGSAGAWRCDGRVSQISTVVGLPATPAGKLGQHSPVSREGERPRTVGLC